MHQNTKKNKHFRHSKTNTHHSKLFVLLPHDLHLSQTRETQKPKAD